MIRFILGYLMLFCVPAQAQDSGVMQVQLEVLPRVLTVSVNSSQLNFAQQRADAGSVTLDPATGLASRKAGDPHTMGELVVYGPADSGFLVSIDHAVALQHLDSSHEVRFTPIWAQSSGCNQGAFVLSSARKGANGVLGDDGCATLRFGGTIHLLGAQEGRYIGQLAVQILPLYP